MNKSNKSKIIKKSREKVEWDSTINDLKAYKSTTEEMRERKLSHQSKNQTLHFNSQNNESDKSESVYDRLTRTRYGNKLKLNDLNQRNDMMKELFVPDRELFELFSQSERALSNVENMFGDHKKRYRVTPSVTLAPDMNSLPQNSNNSNSCALNDFSNSEDENISSKTDGHSTDHGDDLTKFRKFIEKEKRNNDSLQTKLDEKRTVLIESIKKLDTATETEPIVGEENGILEYINSRLENRSYKGSTIVDKNRVVCDRIIDQFERLDKQKNEELSGLRMELNGSKELIDALTLELINNSQQMRRMKIETDSFMKNVTMELSQVKSYVIKYFDQRETSVTPSSIVKNHQESSHYNLADQLFKENFNFGNIKVSKQETEESSLGDQFKQLQIDQELTQKRLKNLMKIQKSLSQIPGDID